MPIPGPEAAVAGTRGYTEGSGALQAGEGPANRPPTRRAGRPPPGVPQPVQGAFHEKDAPEADPGQLGAVLATAPPSLAPAAQALRGLRLLIAAGSTAVS